jgi:DNA-binding transcriptional MerR regulator
MNKHKAFSIGATAKLAGVTQKQLRHWEARGYISPPTRVRMGDRAYRYYSQAQLEKVKEIKSLLNEGYTLSHASKIVRKEGRKDA